MRSKDDDNVSAKRSRRRPRRSGFKTFLVVVLAFILGYIFGLSNKFDFEGFAEIFGRTREAVSSVSEDVEQIRQGAQTVQNVAERGSEVVEEVQNATLPSVDTDSIFGGLFAQEHPNAIWNVDHYEVYMEDGSVVSMTEDEYQVYREEKGF